MPNPRKTRTNTAGSIYAIGAAGSPYIKIGSTTTSVEQRLKTLQTGQPAALHIVAKHPVETDLHRIERQIHKFLAAERHHGEWFALMLDPDALSQLIMRAVDYLAEEDRQAEIDALRPKEKRGEKGGKAHGKRQHPFENCLKEYRTARGVSRAELGVVVGVGHVTVWRWETRKLRISYRALIELARFFQVRPIDLVPALDAPPAKLPHSKQTTQHKQSPETPQLAWEW